MAEVEVAARGYESSDSDASSLGALLGVPEGLSMVEVEDEDEGAGAGEEAPEGASAGAGSGRGSGESDPLFSLAQAERLVVEGDAEALQAMLAQVEARVAAENREGPVCELQLEVLRMAVAVASSDFAEVLASPAVAGVLAAEAPVGGHGGHSVSRVRNRMARFLHERVVEHIHRGLGPCAGRATFKDPGIASPEVHVSQRALRAAACMWLGAALLSLYLQANWTGPPVAEEALEKHYPLPFVRGVYDAAAARAAAKTRYIDEALETLEADAEARSAIAGKKVRAEDMDAFPELHARCALMLGANGEFVYRDARLLHYLHAARIILRVVNNPTVSPGAVDSVDMLENARIEIEGEDEEDGNGAEEQAGMTNQAQVQEMIASDVRLAVTHLATAGWWAARSATTHQESLESQEFGAPSLDQEAQRGMARAARALAKLRTPEKGARDELEARLWLETGIMRHKFKAAESAKEAFAKAQEAAKLNVTLSGMLGKRTKFQKEDKSQLVLLASSETTVLKDEPAAAPPAAAPRTPTQEPKAEAGAEAGAETEAAPNDWGVQYGVDKVRGIRKVKLDELDAETPLHETVQFSANAEAADEAAERARRGTLGLLDQAIVLGLCVDVKNSYAMEGLTAEEMLAYVERVIQSPENWQVYSTGLLIKSQLEFLRMKTKERSLLQMQVLVDQQSDRLTPLQTRQREVDDAAPASERFLWLHGLAWPALWELKRQLAQRYLELGVAGSALKIFEEVKLWEEAADCLVVMDKRARAEKLVRARLEVQPSPNLMCVLGNLLQDATWYSKAWELSGKRYARAKRLWALHAFGQGELRACVDHLQEALRINPLYPGSWFRLGSAALRLEDWQLARTSFAQVTKQEPEDGDAWANLSTALVKLEEYASALNAVANAVKHARSNWKIWENYVMLACRTKQWGMAVDGMSNLIDVPTLSKDSDRNLVDVPSLLLVVDAVLTIAERLRGSEGLDRASAAVDGDESGPAYSQEMLDSLRTQVEALFAKIRAKCKSDANVWKAMSVYYEAFGDRERLRECLVARYRVLQGADQWERSEQQTARIVKVLEDLSAKFTADIASSADASAATALARDLRSLLQSAVDRIVAGTLDDALADPLRALLSELPR